MAIRSVCCLDRAFLSRMDPNPCRQSGIALIYVLIIFLLITTVAAQIVMNLWLHTEKNARYLERTQAKHYALGAEQYVALLLEKDFQQDKKNNRMVDHDNELWNVDTINYEVEQGSIELQVQDEQSLFNINWLAEDNDSSGGKPSGSDKEESPDFQMFENLLFNQSLDPQLAYQVKNWLSKARKPAQSGSEDQFYLSQDPPGRTARTEMVSVSELKLINGFNRDEVEKLLPYITVIPKSSTLNVNTARAEIIRTLNNDITEGDVLMITGGRGDTGVSNFEELNELVALSGKAGLFNEVRQNERVAFSSQYFSVRIKATYRDTTFYLRTLFYRSGAGHVQVVGREIGPSQYWTPGDKEGATGIPEV